MFTPPKAPLGYGKFVVHEVRLVALMQAFAATRGDDREKYLARARAGLAGEFDYVTQQWPELEAFVLEHQEALRPTPRELPEARVARSQDDAGLL